MQKKTYIILISLVVIIALIGIGVLLYRMTKTQKGGAPVTLKDFFPFGSGGGTPNPAPGEGTAGSTPGNPAETPQTRTARLRRVTNDFVIGYTSLKKQVPVDPNTVPAPKQITITTSYTFTKNLKSGDSGTEVKELQKVLNQCPATQVAKTGSGSLGKEGTVFGPATVKAVTAFQELFATDILTPQKLTKGTGSVDELTRKKLQAGFVCTLPSEAPDTILKSIVRYVVLGTSNIYDAYADTLQATRLSATTIPRVHEAFFGDQGKSVFLRTLEADNQTIDTFIGKITEPVVGGDALPELSLFSMPKNISDISVSPDGKQVVFLLPSGNVVNGFISDLEGRNQKKVFSSPFTGWLTQWALPTKLVFTVKATARAPGFAYTTDIGKGDFSKLVGPITGLTTLMSPDGKYVLINQTGSSGLNLMLEDTQTKQIKNLKLPTLPEKCVWTKSSLAAYCSVPIVIPAGSTYPDDWYKGEVRFSDAIWLIDMTGTFDNQIVFSPLTEGGEATDGIKLSLDEDNKYLYFINRETNTLWQYDLKPELEPQTP
jgi:hypothetical protein